MATRVEWIEPRRMSWGASVDQDTADHGGGWLFVTGDEVVAISTPTVADLRAFAARIVAIADAYEGVTP